MVRHMDYLDQCLLKFNKYMNNLGNLTEMQIMFKKFWNTASESTLLATSHLAYAVSAQNTLD